MATGALHEEIKTLKAADTALDTAYKAADNTLAGRVAALEAVAPVRVLATMPAAAAGNNGWVVLFIGETAGDYTQYNVYSSDGSAWTGIGKLASLL
jgi:hypothetical protein